MVGLLDIAPASETVDVLGQPVEVYGVGLAAIAAILRRFPDLQKAMVGLQIEPAALIAVAPDAAAAVMAAGTGRAGDEETERAAAGLPFEAQVDLLAAIVRLTLPSGVGPFVEKLAGLGIVAAGAQSPKDPATSSPPPPKN